MSQTLAQRQPADANRTAMPTAEAPGRRKIRALASGLVEVQLKADVLSPLMTEGNLVLQKAKLTEHIDRMWDLVQKVQESGPGDASLISTIEVGTAAAGIAADLMHLDRLAAIGNVSRVARRGANMGLRYAWEAMDSLAADPLWAVRNRTAADWCITNAAHHRNVIAGNLPRTAVMKAGVTAAQMMNAVVSAPQLLATGNFLLVRLAKWLTGAGGTGTIRIVGAGIGPGSLVIATTGITRALTVAEIEALREAGLLSAKALAMYSVAQGGGAGARPGDGGLSGSRGSRESLQTNDPSVRAANITDPKKVKELMHSLAEKGYKTTDNPALLLETNLYGNRTIKLLVDGNHRFRAAKDLKLPYIEVVRISEAEFKFMCERAGLNWLEVIQRSIKF